jgi:ATP-binding cassette subfamily A (ABC1) protein 3
MLIYSVIYLLLAIYIERVNPGEFGVAQPWNYLFKKSYWKPRATASVQPVDVGEEPGNKNGGIYGSNQWIELNSMSNKKNPSLTVSQLTKVK